MAPKSPTPGRLIALFALAGIALASLSVRTAVTALSPITAEVGQDLALTSVGLGLIGALPVGAFAVAGYLTPFLLRGGGLETGLIAAVSVLTFGQTIRALSPSFSVFFIASVLVFLGIGILTVLIPPLIKRHFPEHQARLTAVYAAGLSISLMAPATFSPLWVDALGWRGVMTIWAVAGGVTLLPWLGILVLQRRARIYPTAPKSADSVAAPVRIAQGLRSRSAWLLAMALAITALNAFVTFAWLPALLQDLLSLSRENSGFLLGYFAIIGFPLAVAVPWMVKRWRRPGVLMQVGSGLFIVCYLGLIYLPFVSPWIWITFSGLGTLIFPLVLTLVNQWSRTEQGALLLTSFMQGAGYSVAVWWPVLIGIVHDQTGSWIMPLWILIGTGVAGIYTGHLMRHWRMVEDEVPGLGMTAKAAG